MKVALTLDDGPSQWTEPILDHLRRFNARATFFVCGHAINEQTAPLLRRMVDEGHEIGNHTFDHPRCTSLTDDQIAGQLAQTQELIFTATQYTPIVWRAPYFDSDERVIAVGERAGLRHVGATVDPADWQSSEGNRIAWAVERDAVDGAIVDLHDGMPPDGGSGSNTRQPTVDAVFRLLEYYTTANFVTVTELNRKIDAEQVAVIVVTRGDVPLDKVFAPFEQFPFGTMWVWDKNDDAKHGVNGVYGRYAAISHATEPVILVLDDDVALTRQAIEGLLANYWPGAITANMPEEFRWRYPDSCLVGFGAIFDRDLPEQAFARAAEWLQIPPDVFNRACDVVFTALTPYQLIDEPFAYLPWTHDANRMYKQPNHTGERSRVIDLCRELREGELVGDAA